jgi:hypothetical protein
MMLPVEQVLNGLMLGDDTLEPYRAHQRVLLLDVM